MKYRNLSLAVLLTLAAPMALSAQSAATETVNKSYIEMVKTKQLWFHSNNSAGLSILPVETYSDVHLGAATEKGDYKFMQEGREINTFNLGSDGAARLKDTYLWGSFNIDRITDNGSQYVSNIYDPYRDMPFYVADKHASQWIRQEYDLRGKAAFPVIGGFLRTGVDLEYTTRTGAKQKDPRGRSYYLTVAVNPSFVFDVTENTHIGFNIRYGYLLEKASMSNSDSQNDQKVFVMRGLGNCFPGVVGGIGGIGSYNWQAHKVGGGIQFGFHNVGAFNILLDGQFSYKAEDVVENPTRPKMVGATRQHIYSASAQFVAEKETAINKIALTFMDKKTQGIEYLQEIDDSYEVQQWVTLAKYVRSRYAYQELGLSYDFFKRRDISYNWRFGASAQYVNRYDEYVLPHSHLKVENLEFNVFAKKNFRLSPKSSLLPGLSLGYKRNLDGEYVYNGVNTLDDPVQMLFSNDIAIHTTDNCNIGFELNFSTMVSDRISLYVDGACRYYSPIDSKFNNRFFAHGSVGITF